jgi:hypothetical protein
MITAEFTPFHLDPRRNTFVEAIPIPNEPPTLMKYIERNQDERKPMPMAMTLDNIQGVRRRRLLANPSTQPAPKPEIKSYSPDLPVTRIRALSPSDAT